MSSISVNTAAGQPISITGLASGFDTSSIINALVEAERVPITHLTTKQEKLQAQQEVLRTVQMALQKLSYAVADLSLPSVFEPSQQVTSSEPLRVEAQASSGAGIGGYQVEVTQLADSAQRTFNFTSPEGEDTVNIDGQEYKLEAGASAKELATKINANGKSTVYAAVLGSGQMVLSTRTTGATGGEFIKVSDTAGALTEKEGSAKEGRNAIYSVDGVEGESTSNTVTEAIAGVTLTFDGLTTTAGAVTINVAAPKPNTKAIEAQLQSFITTYNSTIEEVQKQLATKPVENASSSKEYSVGTLYGDTELEGVLNSMRATMYETVAGLEEGIKSPFDIGISTGAPSSGGASQSALEGQLTLSASKLASAIAENPEGVAKMVQGWSKSLQTVLNNAAAPGEGLETRINGDEAQIQTFKERVTSMNEAVKLREQALVNTYAQLEAAMSRSNAQLSWLSEQTEALANG